MRRLHRHIDAFSEPVSWRRQLAGRDTVLTVGTNDVTAEIIKAAVVQAGHKADVLA